jgi:bifunctional enzyme CysN/CysC
MVTGASTAELAVILIDARKKVLTQTCRHSHLCHLLGIKNFVIAINKMDLVDYDQAIFNSIVSDYKLFAEKVGITNFIAIPISSTNGDNVAINSKNMKWYDGPSLIEHLEKVELETHNDIKSDFYMPVQWVNRPNSDFRGFSGKIIKGIIKPGDKVSVSPLGIITKVDRIVTFDGDLVSASSGKAVTLTLQDEIDCSRGQIITSVSADLEISDQFESTIIWMNEEKLIPGRFYYLKTGSQIVTAKLGQPKYKLNVNTMEHLAAKNLTLNEIGVVNVTTDRMISFLSYNRNRSLGGFILIDKINNATVGAGLINFALRRSQNIFRQSTDITRDNHANLKNQKPIVVWMTGLSGSGKSTIANAVEKKLANMNYHTFLLDGDNLRLGLSKDLGFTDADRIENIRRVGEVAKLMTDAGLIVLTAFISPFLLEREMVRNMIKSDEFIEVFIDTPLSVVELRDVKGLYHKARSGQLKNFTGISSPYEAPPNPEIHIETTKISIDKAADQIVEAIISNQKDRYTQ